MSWTRAISILTLWVFGCLIAISAVLQWIALGERIAAITKSVWKFYGCGGIAPIVVRQESMEFFYLVSSACFLGGVGVVILLRRLQGKYFFIPLVAPSLLLLGMIVWGCLLLSPLTLFVQ